jgi:hypothetical protein
MPDTDQSRSRIGTHYDETPLDSPAADRRVDRANLTRVRADEKGKQDAYESGLDEGRGMNGGSSSSRSKPTPGGRTIITLMTFAVLFALAGVEIERLSKAVTSPSVGTVASTVTGGPRIILGGTVATVALVLLSHAGEPGREFAVGLALITFLSSALIYGAPVWSALSNAIGTRASGPGTGNTSPTAPTTGTATTTALVSAVA